MSIRCRQLLCVVALLAILIAPTPASGDEPVSFALGEWPPYVMANDGGIATQLVEAALDAIGQPREYTYFPWKRSLYLVATEGTDGSFPWRRTPKREEYAIYSDVLIKSRAALFFTNPALSHISYEELEKHPKLSVGGVLGYWYLDELKARGIEMDMSLTSKEGLRKLLAKRIDLLPEDEFVGWAHIHKHFPDQTHKFRHTYIPGVTELHVIFPNTPKGRALRDRFNKGLAIIRANGTYDRIMEAAAQHP